MLCKAVGSIAAVPLPDEAAGEPPVLFEPKWDGFRCIIFRDGDEVVLGSRNEKPLTRYFPELVDPIREQLPDQCVLDGEIVIAGPDGLAFDTLSQRIHPAESRVRKLSVETPASFVAFDLLGVDGNSWMDRPFHQRRSELERVLAQAAPPLHLTPITTDRTIAQDWFVRFEGAGLDGVIAKRALSPYTPNKRSLLKVKHKRTADCVVAGFRMHKDGEGVGSLLLGLFDDNGRLNHVGVAASFSAARRRELVDELAPFRERALAEHPWQDWSDPERAAAWGGAVAKPASSEPVTPATEPDREPGEGQRMPGGLSRWTGTKDLSWFPIRIELVAEVAYENVLNGRFRHGGRFQRWRADRTPESCTYAQLEQVPPYELRTIFLDA